MAVSSWVVLNTIKQTIHNFCLPVKLVMWTTTFILRIEEIEPIRFMCLKTLDIDPLMIDSMCICVVEVIQYTMF